MKTSEFLQMRKLKKAYLQTGTVSGGRNTEMHPRHTEIGQNRCLWEQHWLTCCWTARQSPCRVKLRPVGMLLASHCKVHCKCKVCFLRAPGRNLQGRLPSCSQQ